MSTNPFGTVSTAPRIPTQEELAAIRELPKRQQIEKRNDAVAALLANGRNAQEAFDEVAAATDQKPGTVAAGWYRKQRAEGKGRTVRVTSANREADVVTKPKANGTSAELKELHDLVERMVERRVAARLEQIRRVLG